MDGIEWKRNKWKWFIKFWFYINEIIAMHSGDHLIADNPEIKNHLLRLVSKNKITMIPYGARFIYKKNLDFSLVAKYKLKAKNYATVIARPEPENNILQIVRAFSKKVRGFDLVVVGNYEDDNAYHRLIVKNAGPEVKFIGPQYNSQFLDTLRYFALFYIHGHTVGGTNPSLVEALGASQPVLAHDNKYNRWVAGDAAIYFSDELSLENNFDIIQDSNVLKDLRRKSKLRFNEDFKWSKILKKYEDLLFGWIS